MVFVGIGSVFYAAPWGVAHLSLQPLAYLGLSLLAGCFLQMRPPLRLLALAGMCVDFVLGIQLHFALQNHVFTVRPHVGGLSFENTAGLSAKCLMNWYEKDQHGYVFLGDHLAGAASAIQLLIVAAFVGWLVWAARVSLREPVP